MTLKSVFYPARIGRMEYIARYVPPNLALLYWASLDGDATPGLLPFSILLSVALIPFAVLPRVRDTGMSYWILILAVLPFLDRALGFALLFKRGAPVLLADKNPTAASPARAESA